MSERVRWPSVPKAKSLDRDPPLLTELGRGEWKDEFVSLQMLSNRQQHVAEVGAVQHHTLVGTSFDFLASFPTTELESDPSSSSCDIFSSELMPVMLSKVGVLGDQHCKRFEKVALLRHVHGYRRDSSRGERSAFAVLSDTIPGCESSCCFGETPSVLWEQVEKSTEEV